MNLRQNKLGDLVTITGGGTPDKKQDRYWGGTIPWATVKDFTGIELSKTQDNITEEGLYNSAANLIPPGRVIMPTRMGLGKAAINTIPLAINQDLKALTCSERINVRYLLHFILFSGTQIEKMGTGATVKGINLNQLKSIKVPLPPLPIQKKIASILEKAELARQKRRQATRLTDEFLKSTFLEMFGDPIKNPKGWDIIYLNDVCSKITDGEHLNPEFVQDGIPMVMAKNVVTTGIDFNEIKYISLEDYKKFSKKCYSEYQDILIVSRGATIGRCTLVNTDRQFSLMGSVILIKPKRNLIKPFYLNSLLSHPAYQSKLYKTSSSSAQNAIYLSHLKKISIPVPPFELQEHFAGLFIKTNKLKEKQRESEKELDNLFNSLIQKAFRGGIGS